MVNTWNTKGISVGFRNKKNMKNENLIISGFIGFTIGVIVMLFINFDKSLNHYQIIQDIEYEVCEECWYEVFDCGDRYKEVEYYVNGE